MEPPSYGMAMGTMWGFTHVVRILVNRGLVSPAEVDEIYGSLMEGINEGDANMAAIIDARLQVAFAEMRQWAEKLYKG